MEGDCAEYDRVSKNSHEAAKKVEEALGAAGRSLALLEAEAISLGEDREGKRAILLEALDLKNAVNSAMRQCGLAFHDEKNAWYRLKEDHGELNDILRNTDGLNKEKRNK